MQKISLQKLRYVILAHLSETNNEPELALECAQKNLDGHCATIEVIAATQNIPTACIHLDQE